MNKYFKFIINNRNLFKYFSQKTSKGINITKLKKENLENKNKELKNNFYDNLRSYCGNKLIEIQNRYNIIKDDLKIIEFGSCPGSWSQVIQYNSKNSKILSIDKDNMLEIKGIDFLQINIENPEIFIKIKQHFNNDQVDLIISDLNPTLWGDIDCDFSNLAHLNKIMLEIAIQNLKVGGTFWFKSISGTLEEKVIEYFKINFGSFEKIKLSTSKYKSSEYYYLGKNFKQNNYWFNLKKLMKKEKIDLKEINKCLPINLQMTLNTLFIKKYTYIKEGYDKNFLFEMNLINKILKGKEEKLKKEIDIDKILSSNSNFNQFEKYYLDNLNKYSFTRKFPRNYKEMIEIYEEEVPKLIKNFNRSKNNEFDLLDLDNDLNNENNITNDQEDDEDMFYEDWDYLKQDIEFKQKSENSEKDLLKYINEKKFHTELENNNINDDSKEFDGFDEKDYEDLEKHINDKDEFESYKVISEIDDLNYDQFKKELNEEINSHKNKIN